MNEFFLNDDDMKILKAVATVQDKINLKKDISAYDTSQNIQILGNLSLPGNFNFNIYKLSEFNKILDYFKNKEDVVSFQKDDKKLVFKNKGVSLNYVECEDHLIPKEKKLDLSKYNFDIKFEINEDQFYEIKKLQSLIGKQVFFIVKEGMVKLGCRDEDSVDNKSEMIISEKVEMPKDTNYYLVIDEFVFIKMGNYIVECSSENKLLKFFSKDLGVTYYIMPIDENDKDEDLNEEDNEEEDFDF